MAQLIIVGQMLLDPSGEQKIIYFIKAIIVNSWVLTFRKIGNPF